jgi:hypothetical protein
MSRFSPKPLSIIALLLVTASGILAPSGSRMWGSNAATVRISSGDVGLGEIAEMSLEVVAVPGPGLGAVTIDVSYEADTVEPTACAEAAGGVFDTMLCNTGYRPGIVRFAGIRANPGAVGDLFIATIAFRAVGEPGQCSDLTLNVITLADIDGRAIRVASSQPGSLCIRGPSDSSTPSATVPAPLPPIAGPSSSPVDNSALPPVASATTASPGSRQTHGTPPAIVTATLASSSDEGAAATAGPERTAMALGRRSAIETPASEERPAATQETDGGGWTLWIVVASSGALAAGLLGCVAYRRLRGGRRERPI